MERKIGEIFKYNGEWYQCIIGHCNQCCFDEAGTCKFIGCPYCAYRNDKKLVCFNKLEKVGEPYRKRVSDGTFSTFRRYRVYNSVILPKEPYIYCNFIDNTIEIEIKQNKEDMEEKNLKPFDFQKAREGKPVRTRDGRQARIICADAKSEYPVIALVERGDGTEAVISYRIDGRRGDNCLEASDDIMMLTEKKEGWVNVYKGGLLDTKSYSTKKEAFDKASPEDYVDTVKINWSE